MFSALLLAGLLAAPIATIALFMRRPVRWGASEGTRRRVGRLAGALIWSVVLVAVVAALLALIGVTTRNIAVDGIWLLVASLIWLPATRRWSPLAHVCWSCTFYVFVVYLAFMAWWTFASHLGVAGDVGGMLLWALELFAALLGLVYLWELCDVLGRASWIRRIGEPQLESVTPSGRHPFVSLHVPCYNEPPEMVIETLRSLCALDYPAFEVIVIDDNTDEDELWHPVGAWCQEHAVKFIHLSAWPGYKSGALNYALTQMIDPRTELIGVVDSDYQIEPDFLKRCAPLFDDPQVGFIQAPQDYRDWEHAPFYRRLYFSYKYFFAVSQPSRNERDGAIFAGTMGLIRREALEQVGGWDEWCITEDAELSLRLLRAGWSGLHVDSSFGKGVMPLTFESLKGQRFRWCFGGIQILRRHWRSMMPGRPNAHNRLTAGQRWAYFSGAFQWYGDLLALVFFVFLLVGAGNIVLSGGLVFRKLTGFLLGAIPLLVVLGLLRAVALVRRGTGASWRDAIGAFLIWQSTALTVAQASVQALFAKEAAFLRTPKTLGEPRLSDAFRANWVETLLGLLGVVAIVGAVARGSGYGGWLIGGLLLWPTLSFLSAPYNSVSAQRAALPPELRERRRTEYQRGRALRATYAAGGLGVAGAGAAAAMALFVPGPANVLPPQIVAPSQGHSVTYGPRASAAAAGSRNPATAGGVRGGRHRTRRPGTRHSRHHAGGAGAGAPIRRHGGNTVTSPGPRTATSPTPTTPGLTTTRTAPAPTTPTTTTSAPVTSTATQTGPATTPTTSSSTTPTTSTTTTPTTSSSTTPTTSPSTSTTTSPAAAIGTTT
jgi:cellulose synthase/poly-beta-1,6-N-acetylglucosamine synthase-like glycosyltransferase